MNTIWSIRTGIRDFLEVIYRTCQAWIEKYPFIKTAYMVFSWLSLIMFALSLVFVKESRTMMVQYLWSFYVLLQFWFLCRSKTMPWKPIVLFVLAGVFLVVPFTTLTVNALHVLFSGKTSDLWSIAVITPIFEELWKLLPLGIFLLFSRRASALSLSDYTLIGAATGVGFQLMEELSRRWLSSGILAKKFGYSFTMLGGETIHWDFFSLFPGRFEESLFPTLMTVGHPVHTAMIALSCGIAYRLRTRLTKWVFLFPVIILLWSILDHAAYNGQHKLPGWVFRLHDWIGSGYTTQPTFLLMLATSLFADYWSLNKIRNRLPSLPNEPFLNPFIELCNMARSFCLDRGKFIYWLSFYRERRELGFHLLYGNEEATDRKEVVQAQVKALCQTLTVLTLILLVASLFAGIGAYTGGGETACFACMFDSLQDWWDRLEWYEQGALLLGALALSLLFVGFWPALGIGLSAVGIAGSGHEIAGYIRDPKKLLTPENMLSVAIGIAISRIPFGKALRWVGEKGRRYVRKLLDKLGSRKPDVDVPVKPKPPKNDGISPDKHPDDPKKPDDDTPNKADEGTGELKTEEVIAPQSGKAIKVYTDGNTIIPVDKIEKYLRGKVNVNIQELTKELRDLKQLRQTQRKVFDADPQNAERIKRLEKMKHNFDRSDDMRQKLESIGLSDTIENNQSIAQHLLEVGKQVNPENTLDFPSILEGPDGKLKVLTTWKMVDGQPYLSTIKLIPTTI
ncbi:PrsW family glutamic-type intramembrane protease [Paenibacillus sp. WQ 127069]|uniref:PrsW family glutamic-type intramembrane protease n=1 Tax=Paenibacillus baimaensis TaxID=2982185 RepID=A0ABT2UEJ8_9BACL|nr:PrsW family glutamic-type intramembrane protease [Paenibacillus sp. WQ 127069]MCU6792327.1 PrsW family glutamic-type intramembrane protease [Paenibacillus sp. WQ 127069]